MVTNNRPGLPLPALTLTMLLAGSTAFAAPTSVERLGKDLTPMGGEVAGNAEGTIPAWTGGLTKAPEGWTSPASHRIDPFADDKVLFTITAKNYQQYEGNLSEGQVALLKAFPDTYKMKVYQTRRTAAAPTWVYENIKKNAATAKLVDDGNGVDGAYGGIPFPVPANGLEVVWNHLARFQGSYLHTRTLEALVQPSGVSSRWYSDVDLAFNYYQPGSSAEETDNQLLSYSLSIVSPARDAGYGTLALDYLNAASQPRKAWQYDPGERRVRRAPNMGFDSPDRTSVTTDDFLMYNGSPERYDFKLVGKKEIYIPYNNYKLVQPELSFDDLLIPGHMNQEPLRYELHRVWVVEATLKEGQRHIYAKRVFYIDEDSWNAAYIDKYDGKGELWRTSTAHLKTFYDVPMTAGFVFNHMDLKNGVYYSWGLTNEFDESYNLSLAAPKKSFYTPQALRRRGR